MQALTCTLRVDAHVLSVEGAQPQQKCRRGVSLEEGHERAWTSSRFSTIDDKDARGGESGLTTRAKNSRGNDSVMTESAWTKGTRGQKIKVVTEVLQQDRTQERRSQFTNEWCGKTTTHGREHAPTHTRAKIKSFCSLCVCVFCVLSGTLRNWHGPAKQHLRWIRRRQIAKKLLL